MDRVFVRTFFRRHRRRRLTLALVLVLASAFIYLFLNTKSGNSSNKSPKKHVSCHNS